MSTIEYGDPATQADRLRQLSPIHKVNRVMAPTIVLHGANDTYVAVVEAEQVAGGGESEAPQRAGGVRPLPRRRPRLAQDADPYHRIRSTVATTQWFDRSTATWSGSRRSAERPLQRSEAVGEARTWWRRATLELVARDRRI